METAPVLLVDDDPAILSLYEAVLGEMGRPTVRAPSAAAALAALAAGTPALVVLDLNMGAHGAGLRVLEALRHTHRSATVPVLICSADDRLLRDQGGDLHALGCATLGKPFDLADLAGTLRALLT